MSPTYAASMVVADPKGSMAVFASIVLAELGSS
jgi:hypothetical protein